MKLIVLDDKTKLPTISGEALTIKCFADLWKRRYKVEGDHDGREKIMNLKLVGYVYFMCVYDTRFKLKSDTEKDKAVRNLLHIPDNIEIDALVKECMTIYSFLQETASRELVLSLEGAAESIAKYIKLKRAAIETGTLDAQEVKVILDIIDRAPTTIETIAKAKAVLNKEQDALATGRNKRTTNLFEMPER